MDNPFKNLSPLQRNLVIGGTVIVLGFMEFQHHKSSGSWNPFASGNAATGNPSDINPLTGLPYSQDNVTDPVTGQTYLDEANQYGSVAAAEASVSAYGISTATGSGIGVNPASPPSSGSINTPVGTDVYTSNQAWAQAVQAGLTDVGYDAQAVAEALGAFLTQTPVTAAQAKLINTAIAEYGRPPVGNLQIILMPITTPGTVASATVSGGHVISVNNNRASVGWTGHNAVKYKVAINGPGFNMKTNTITAERADFSGLQAKHTYSVYVTPYNSAGSAGPTGTINFVTT